MGIGGGGNAWFGRPGRCGWEQAETPVGLYGVLCCPLHAAMPVRLSLMQLVSQVQLPSPDLKGLAAPHVPWSAQGNSSQGVMVLLLPQSKDAEWSRCGLDWLLPMIPI